MPNVPPLSLDAQLYQGQTHIVPRHSWRFQDRDSASDIFLDVLEVHYAGIIVVLSNEQSLLKSSGVYISKRVVVSIPATEAEINSADGGEVIVHDHDLFVVRPELNGICGGGIHLSGHPTKRATADTTLAANVIGVPHDNNVRVKRFQCMFRPRRRHIHCLGYLETIGIGRG